VPRLPGRPAARLAVPLLLPALLLGAASAARADDVPPAPPAPPAAPAPPPLPAVLTGTVLGSDGRAVDALLGFDWLDAQGHRLDRNGCIQSPTCPVPGYGTVLRINPDLVATGTADTSTATTTFSVQPPPGAARLFLEAYPQDETHRTNEARYGHAMRHSVALPYDGPLPVTLPLVLCDQGGRVGTVRGTATKDGQPFALKRVVAWSLEPFDALTRPVLGWNIGTASADGTFAVPNLAGDQRYQVWVTAQDDSVRKSFGVVVPGCGETALSVSFDPPKPDPVEAPAPVPPPAPSLVTPVVTAGQGAVVEAAADPGATVVLMAATRPSTTLRVVRRTTASPSGYVAFTVYPNAATELRLATPAGLVGAPVVLGVRSHVSLAAAKTVVPRTYRFTGRLLPGRTQAVSLYQRTATGRRLLASGTSQADGTYSIVRRFLVPGPLDVQAVSQADALNAEGSSASVHLRV
jgi:hypothetical protein